MFKVPVCEGQIRPASELVPAGGPGMAGKCVTGDTLVLGADGLISIREHWQRARGEVLVSVRGWSLIKMPPATPDTFLEYATEVVARTRIAQTSHVYYGGVRETIRVRTSLGMEIKGTPNHRVWTQLGVTGNDWQRLDDLSVGMSVAVRGDNVWSDTSHPESMGKMVGERARIEYPDREPALTGFLFRCQRESVVGFLSEFFAGHKLSGVDLRGKSPEFLRRLQLLLRNLGIVSRYERQGDEASLSLDRDEWARLQAEFTNEPNAGGRRAATDMWDKVVSLEASSAEVFDLSVPDEESFVGNGFINHDTAADVFAAF